MDFRKTHAGGGYGSEFESDAEVERNKRLRKDLAIKESQSQVTGGLPSKRVAANEYDREESKNQRFHFLALDAYNRHKQLVNDYLLYYPGATKDFFKRDASKDKTDLDVIRENHRFLWTAEDEEDEDWGKSLSKKYWDKLFKEYCIADLSRYKENKIAMRWRVEREVFEGKGHFECGNKRCSEQIGLRTWEVNFGYIEHGEKKNALVKLRLCERCSHKLNYHKRCKEVTRKPCKDKSSDRRRTDSPLPKRHKGKHKDIDKVKDKDSGKVKHKDSDKVKHKDSDKVKHKDIDKVRHKDTHRDRDRDGHRRKHRKEKRHKKSRSRSRSRKRRDSSSGSEDSSGGEGANKRSTPADPADSTSVPESDFWTGPAPVIEEKSREDEMDDFLKDMFL